MNIFVPALISTVLGLSLAAQTTGVLAGKVLDSAGKPIANVKFSASKVDITRIKEITVGKEGRYVQVGFAPGDYDLSISAPGFIEQKINGFHIGVGDVTQKDIVLLRPEEAAKDAGKNEKAVTLEPDASTLAENKVLETFNQAVVAFNEKKYSEALPLFESAMASMNESIPKMADEAAKAEAQKKLATMELPAAITMMEAGKVDASKQAGLIAKAEPLLLKSIERDPKDQTSLIYLIELAKAKKDIEGAKKYQAALDEILGPRPELAHNQGVDLYNAGKLSEAKPFFKKAIQMKPDYAEPYFLLAMCEFTDMNLKNTKLNLQKYLELAPKGKDAATAKEMLADPSLKNVK